MLAFQIPLFYYSNRTSRAIQRPPFNITPTSLWACTISSSREEEPNNMNKVEDMRNILKATNSWEKCWSEDVTPWDLGRVTPIVADLVQRNDLPTGRALVPGCGSGHDVFALVSPTRHVVGLDISSTAIERARQVLTKTGVDFVCTDFFTYEPGTPFDLILDYTVARRSSSSRTHPCSNVIYCIRFFCALQPSLRPLWGSKMAELLAPDGELITIMFPMDDHEGGPPYPVSVEAYEKALHPQGFTSTLFQENVLAVDKRKGLEYLGRWKRITSML